MKSVTITAIVIVIMIIVGASAYGLMSYLQTTSSVQTTTSSSRTTTSSLPTSASSAQTSIGSSVTPTSTPINIGLEEIQGGSTAGYTNDATVMAQIAVNQINANGGLLGHPVRLFVANEAPNPVAAAQSLVLQHNVSAIIGITFSGDGVAVMPFLSAHHIITIFTTASLNKMMDNVSTRYNDYKYFFRQAQPDRDKGPDLAPFLSTVIKPASAYFVGGTYSYAYENLAGYNQSWTQMGIKTLGASILPPSQTDFSTLVTQLASLKPAMILNDQPGSEGGTFIVQLRANPATAHIPVIYDGSTETTIMDPLLKTNPGAVETVMMTSFPGTDSVPANQVGATLTKTFDNMTGEKYYPYVALVYSAVRLYGQAVINANSLNTDSIVTALENINFTSPFGQVTFDKNHNWNSIPASWVLQYQNGVPVVIFPPQFATAKYKAP